MNRKGAFLEVVFFLIFENLSHDPLFDQVQSILKDIYIYIFVATYIYQDNRVATKSPEESRSYPNI